MTTQTDLERVRWLLAAHLQGMWVKCPHAFHPHQSLYHYGIEMPEDCPGYWPMPLTAEGLIDEGRLRRAIESAGAWVSYQTHHHKDGRVEGSWRVAFFANRDIGENSELAISFLMAKGVWNDAA